MAGTRNYDFLVSDTKYLLTRLLIEIYVADQIVVDRGLWRGQVVLSFAVQ